jgi:hypothetical protein
MHRLQELARRIVREIADRRAGEIDDVAQRRNLRVGQGERLRKVGHDGQDLDVRKLRLALLRRLQKVILGDVDRHVSGKVVQVLEQNACLAARAAAELDQAGLGADEFGDLVDVVAHDAELGLGRVVLRQMRDPVEQLRAALVVEVFRRDHFLGLAQAVEDLVEFRLFRRGRHQFASFASRKPRNCQRASG